MTVITEPAGFDTVTSRFSRDRWLPKVGPTTYLLAVLIEEHAGQPVDLFHLARRLGVQPNKVLHSVQRGVKFGLFAQHPDGTVTVDARGVVKR